MDLFVEILIRCIDWNLEKRFHSSSICVVNTFGHSFSQHVATIYAGSRGGHRQQVEP